MSHKDLKQLISTEITETTLRELERRFQSASKAQRIAMQHAGSHDLLHAAINYALAASENTYSTPETRAKQRHEAERLHDMALVYAIAQGFSKQ
jgi:hypothetical protein